MNDQESRIVELSDKRAVEFLEAGMAGTTPEQRQFMREQAMFGFRARREITMNKRLGMDQQLRAIKLFSDPKVRDGYATMMASKVLPDLKGKTEKK